MEGVFRESDRGMAGRAPWTMGWQQSERDLVWGDDLRLRLLKVLPRV